MRAGSAHTGAWAQDNPDAASKFQDVNKAYEVLRDPQKRQQYDQMGAAAFEQAASMGGDAGAGGFGGFGGFRQARRRASPRPLPAAPRAPPRAPGAPLTLARAAAQGSAADAEEIFRAFFGGGGGGFPGGDFQWDSRSRRRGSDVHVAMRCAAPARRPPVPRARARLAPALFALKAYPPARHRHERGQAPAIRTVQTWARGARAQGAVHAGGHRGQDHDPGAHAGRRGALGGGGDPGRRATGPAPGAPPGVRAMRAPAATLGRAQPPA